jgi:hypothetical protein
MAAAVAGLWWHRANSVFRVPPVVAALAWIALALAIQRVIPFVRTWVFLVPLYAALVAVGLSHAAAWLLRGVPRMSAGRLAPVAACLLAVSIGLRLASDVTTFRPRGGTFVEAPEIMSMLERSATAGEKVVLSPASYIMFRAYARLNGFAFDRYVTSAGGAEHGFAVVNEAWNETLPPDVATRGGNSAGPRLLLRVGTAAVYRW